jgi:hypothetical protein
MRRIIPFPPNEIPEAPPSDFGIQDFIDFPLLIARLPKYRGRLIVSRSATEGVLVSQL